MLQPGAEPRIDARVQMAQDDAKMQAVRACRAQLVEQMASAWPGQHAVLDMLSSHSPEWSSLESFVRLLLEMPGADFHASIATVNRFSYATAMATATTLLLKLPPIKVSQCRGIHNGYMAAMRYLPGIHQRMVAAQELRITSCLPVCRAEGCMALFGQTLGRQLAARMAEEYGASMVESGVVLAKVHRLHSDTGIIIPSQLACFAPNITEVHFELGCVDGVSMASLGCLSGLPKLSTLTISDASGGNTVAQLSALTGLTRLALGMQLETISLPTSLVVLEGGLSRKRMRLRLYGQHAESLARLQRAVRCQLVLRVHGTHDRPTLGPAQAKVLACMDETCSVKLMCRTWDSSASSVLHASSAVTHAALLFDTWDPAVITSSTLLAARLLPRLTQLHVDTYTDTWALVEAALKADGAPKPSTLLVSTEHEMLAAQKWGLPFAVAVAGSADC